LQEMHFWPSTVDCRRSTVDDLAVLYAWLMALATDCEQHLRPDQTTTTRTAKEKS